MAASTRTQFVDPSISFPIIDPSLQTRLLHLSSNRGHGITCRLSIVSLYHPPPPFEALSYVWGSAEDLEVITVDGNAFRVTQNLYAALKSLVPLDDTVRVLWIDAICINQGAEQGDLAERGEQVRLMSRIFSGATRVIAYLGEPYPGLIEAMEFLTVAYGGQQSQFDQLIQDVGYNATQLRTALRSFFNQPWWNRIWTVQEAIVRKLSFQLGTHQIDFDMVNSAVKNLLTPELRLPFELDTVDPDSGEGLPTLAYKIRLLSLPLTRSSLLSALGLYQYRASGDPRDKIYSLLGLFPSFQHVVDLDYAIRPEQLFQNFTLAWIQTFQDLEVLGFLHDPESRVHRNMPSFAVDWSYRPSIRSIISLQIRKFLQNEVFDACKGTKAFWHRDSSGRVCAKGFVFDSIEAIGGKDDSISNTWNTRFRNLQGIVSMAHERAGNDRQETETLNTMRHTLCMDCVEKAGVSSRLQGEDDERVLDAWWDIVFKPSGPTLADRLAFDQGPIESTVRVASEERSFIFTRSGSMGLAPDWCKPGDAIAIMGGGAVPIVLRPVNQMGGPEGDSIPCFEVVGEAYVHGFMDGQAFDASGRKEGDFDDIYIV